ncbi:MAG: hypothetical protein IPP33_10150 [Flavobacteriales bacterium]|nr:hypothetical protein [Flavobacteriales bacterium]
MGSNNVVTINATGVRIGSPIEVGRRPNWICLDEIRSRVYVLNKFEGTVSAVDMVTDKEVARANFFDPTPQVIKAGRKHMYNTHLGSGNGHIACGSCHVDSRWDRLGWDLGDPSGNMTLVDGKNFHPLKGVKTTQFLVDIIEYQLRALPQCPDRSWRIGRQRQRSWHRCNSRGSRTTATWRRTCVRCTVRTDSSTTLPKALRASA